MQKLRLFILESSSWRHICATWVAERGYAVDVGSDWQTSNSILKQKAYDLILLDESFLSADMFAAQKLTRDGIHVAVISSTYSIDGYKKVIKAGGSGYINKEFDQDTFIREVEKVLRMIGKLPKRGRLLIVDNDSNVLIALKNSLSREGYEIYAARNAEDAKKSIELIQPHVAIIDIRLRDDDDPLDQSGFDLITEINEHYKHAMRIIGLTGSPGRSTVSIATGLVSQFVLKDHESRNVDSNELVNKIEAAREELGINLSLDIEFKEPLSLLGLVEMIKAYKNLSNEKRERVSIELEELIRKLFRRELKVKGTYIYPGKGGSGVVLMRPIVEGTKGHNFVVKFGSRQNIAIELNNYNLYVKPFTGNHSTQLIDISDKPVETLNLGGLKFSFAGMSVDEPRDFYEFYRDSKVTEAQICTSLEYLFHETCESWYKAKRDWPNKDQDALASAYESQLSLSTLDKQQELVKSCEQLLTGESFHGITFKFHNRDHIRVQLGELDMLLPSPLEFLKNNRTKFPIPKFECRTHGDLNSRNMFIDKDNKVWLIDFFKTKWGPLLRDFGELECVIKFELMDTNNFISLYEFEKSLLSPSRFDMSIEFVNRFHIAELNKARNIITMLRQLAQEQFESLEIREYYASIFFYSLKMLTWEGFSSAEMGRYPIRQRHALLSAAMIAHRLEHWDDKWRGWPADKTISHIL